LPKGPRARSEVTLNTAIPARPRTKVRADARGGVREQLAAGVMQLKPPTEVEATTILPP
jgi:hypothetical protein